MSKRKKKKPVGKKPGPSIWVGEDGTRYEVGVIRGGVPRFEAMLGNPFIASGAVGVSYGMMTPPKGEGWNIGVL